MRTKHVEISRVDLWGKYLFLRTKEYVVTMSHTNNEAIMYQIHVSNFVPNLEYKTLDESSEHVRHEQKAQ